MRHSPNLFNLSGPTYSVWFLTALMSLCHCVIPLMGSSFLQCWGRGISEQEKALFSLPSRMGGMGLKDPVESAEMAYSASKDGTVKIVKAIKGDEEFTVHEHRERIAETHIKLRMHGAEGTRSKEARCCSGIYGC